MRLGAQYRQRRVRSVQDSAAGGPPRHFRRGGSARRRLRRHSKLLRDACLAESLGQPVDVGLVAKWEPPDVLGKRVFRVDFHQLAPDLTRFLGLTQMAERDGKEGAREIGLRTEQDALLNREAATL